MLVAETRFGAARTEALGQSDATEADRRRVRAAIPARCAPSGDRRQASRLTRLLAPEVPVMERRSGVGGRRDRVHAPQRRPNCASSRRGLLNNTLAAKCGM